MFTEWNFLLAEIWGLLALAALIGVLAGWLIRGGRGEETGLQNGLSATLRSDADEVRRLRGELDRARAQGRAGLDDPIDDVPDMQGGGYSRPVLQTAPLTTPAPLDARAAPAPTDTTTKQPPADDRPKPLDAPRDGLPDDLTKIRGVGDKLEALCNSLGIYHYDQIANWTAREVAWVDENLVGFKGRVSRDGWVKQAKALGGNGFPDFVRRPH